MVAWLPLIKVALPYIAPIIGAAIPAFTQKSEAGKDVVPTQISELQAAVTRNSESVKAIATQFQETARRVDDGMYALQKELLVLKMILGFVSVIALAAIGVSVWAVSLHS